MYVLYDGVCFLYFSCSYWAVISCLSSSIFLVNKDIENIHNFVWTTRKCTLYFCFHISQHTLISWHMLQPTGFFPPHIGSFCFISEKFTWIKSPQKFFFLKDQNDILKHRATFQVQGVPQKVVTKHCQSITIVTKLANSCT